jgi:hypothetical protein
VTARDEHGLGWWIARGGALAFLPGVVTRMDGMGPGWRRVVALGRDALARPHSTPAVDRLRLECREMAELLVQIAAEDGHALTVAECLLEVVLEAARLEARAEVRQ